MRYLLTIAILICLLGGVASAQFVDDASRSTVSANTSLGVKPAVTPFSLIDFSRIRWSNSYSVTFFSGGLGSGSLGLWKSRMSYELSQSLSVAFDLNMLHNPSALTGNTNSDATILPGFSVDFHPSKNFNMRLDYRTIDYRNDYLFWRGDRY